MAKKIYIGEILGEVMSKVEALQVDMQSVANQMLDVAKNTSYLENLYLVTGRRANVTYSGGDNSLAARLSANLHLYSPVKTVTAGGATITYAGGYMQQHKIMSTATTNIAADVTDYVKCLIKIKLTSSNTNPSYPGTFVAEIDGVPIAGTSLSALNAAPEDSALLEIDLSAVTSLSIDFKITDNGNSGTTAKIFLYFEDSNGYVYTLFPTGSAAVSAQKITLAADNIAASFTLSPVTGLAIAQWDCLTWLISNGNVFDKVDVLDSSGNVLISGLSSGEALSELTTLEFYLRFHFQVDDTISPVLESVSYLYMT